MKSIILSLSFLILACFGFGQNPTLVKDIYTGSYTSGIQEIVQTGDLTFFNAHEFNNDFIRGLFRTDGTSAGTFKIDFQSTGYTYGKAEKITALGNKVIFAGNNYKKNGEIWVSDGTAQGTILLDRLQPTVDIVPVVEIVAMGNHAYYTAVGNNNSTVLKKTDGTLSGTTTVFDFGTILNLPMVGLLAPINGVLYFNVYDVAGSGFDQLWKSDGTTAGTFMVKNFGTGNSVASKPMQAGSFFYIMMVETGVGNVLWKSDGTTAGTAALKVISARSQDLSNNIYPPFAAIGSTLYFAGLNENGMELWKSDGTVDGTGLAIDLYPGTTSSSPKNLTVLNGDLYFSGRTPDAGIELCRFDGVDANVVADINEGTGIGFSSGSGMVVSNGVLLFSGYTLESGWELWMSDGIETTAMVADLNPGPGVGGASFLTSGNTVYFTGYNSSATGVELFKFDNTAGLAGLHKVYVNDNSQVGDKFVATVGNDANTGSVSSPVATISHAISIANPGDTIIVDAGSYEGQIIINKPVSLRGAGKTLTKILETSEIMVGGDPSNDFNETGLIQSAPGTGDISIEDLSLIGTGAYNAQHGILIQDGGQVLNCSFDKMNNGIFFRYSFQTNLTALVKGNEMHDLRYVGINFQGGYMSATMTENNINLDGATYGMGVIAGGDFGSLRLLDASNNIVSGFNGWGMKINAEVINLTQNSIVGTAGYAIQQEEWGVVESNCNWLGSSSLADVLKKIKGTSIINSILSNGTDTNPSIVGFQIDEANCIQPPPQFYVNDNSTEGDKFTYAVGDDNNTGSKEAPFATVGKALSVMAPGDYVFVDAGTYAERVFFGKSTSLVGAGADLVKFIWPTTVTPSFVFNNIPTYNQFDSYNNGSGNPAYTVNVSGITIDGENRIFNENANVHGLRFHNAGGTVENCVFKNFQNLGASNPVLKKDRAVYFQADATSPAQVNFTNNKIVDFYTLGLLATGAGLSLNATGNEIIGNGIATIRQTGVVAEFIKTVQIENNTISSLSSYTNGIDASYGVSLFGIANASFIKSNQVINSPGGFFSNNTNITVEGNELTTQHANGIVLEATSGTRNATVSSNLISGSSQYGILVASFNGGKSNVNLQQNSVSNAVAKNIYNFGANNISATCNWLGAADANSIYASIFGPTTVNSWLSSGEDASPDTRGFQKGEITCVAPPTSFYVNDNSMDGDVLTDAIGNDGNPGTKELPLATVKRAMEISLPGTTIYVDAGDYTEQVLIRKSLVISGAGRDKTKFHLPDNMVLNYQTTGGGSTYDNYAVFHAQDVTGATIQNIAVDGGNTNFNKGRLFGISLQRSSGVVNGCEVRNFKNTNSNNPVWSTGSGIIGINFASTVRNIEVFDNIVKDFYYSGIIMAGPTVTYQVHDNTIEGNGSNEFSQYGIEVYAGAGSVKNNTISNIAEFTAIDAYEAAGILVGTYTAATEISGNRITNAEAGILLGNGSHVVKNNEVTGSFEYGIGAYASGSSNNVSALDNNILLDNAVGFYFENFGTGTVTAEVHNNSITGSIINSFLNVNATVNASCNWFGVITKPEIEFYVNGTVNFTPWLIDGEDTDLETVGFQPKDGVCTGNPFALSLVSQTDIVNCGDDQTGEIDVSIEGGVGPLVIQWTKQGDETFNASTEDLSSITKGIYDLLVTDANGETLSLQVDLKGPDLLDATVYSEPAYCYGESSGRLQVFPYGGTPNEDYVYGILWSDGSTDEQRMNVSPGLYAVTVTDTKGCSITYSDIEVNAPDQILPVLSATDVLCNGGATGTALSSPTGGTLGVLDDFSTYTYRWSNSATTATISGLSAGTYSVVVEDDYGCTGTASITVVQPTVLRATTQVTNVLCNGESNGSVTVNANGGTPPYMYSIDNGAIGSSTLFGSLAIGSHTVKVIDNNNCEITLNFAISQPTPILISIPTVVATCLGSSTGSIALTATGGTGTLNYSWTGPNGYTSNRASITGLAAGTYTLTVIDRNNCTKSIVVNITAASAITISGTVVNVGCFGATTGSITLVSPVVQTGITYAWTGPNNYRSTARNIGALRAGIYTVTVKLGACSYVQSFTVTQPSAALAMTLTKVDITACGGRGTINVASTTGGTAPYQYSLNNAAFQSAGTFTGLAAGTYTVRVRDANQCLFSSSTTIADNGNDSYEPNNKQTVASAYLLNSGNINARIAPAATDIDWYKFTAKPTAGLRYTITLTHPTIRYAFDLYDSRARLVAPSTSVAGLTAIKTYTNLVAGAVYSLRIQGSLSLICYQMSITDGTGIISQANPVINTLATAANGTTKPAAVPVQLEASVVPNPHLGQFNLNIASPVNGIAKVELVSVSGQVINQQQVSLKKGSNSIRYEHINSGMLIYRVTINGLQTTGRILGIK